MKIRAMTFNIRCDVIIDGKNRFDKRKPLIKKMLTREMPDVIGFQEAVPRVRDWLCENLGDYIILGTGRNADFSGESVSIAYRKDKYDLISFRQFWLSDTPEIPGSRYDTDQSKYPRICAFASLASKDNGKAFVFANTHLDHEGKTARTYGAKLVISELIKEKLPFILTGDFNAKPDDTAIKTILNHEGVNDLTASLGKDFATYHGYGKIKSNCKIDYIFSNGTCDSSTLTIHKDHRGDRYLSDHYPISVTVKLG